VSPLGAALAASAAAVAPAGSKSNSQESQYRPDLAAPQRGHGPPSAASAAGTCGCGSGGRATGGAARLAGAPILIPQTSQKSSLADV